MPSFRMIRAAAATRELDSACAAAGRTASAKFDRTHAGSISGGRDQVT